ncbi:hypothetical protein NOCARDAX2BIS_240053 [Nocardioides sp. AX2bis]|nr:hypothetical protein NOCARDAX2BIS_240053 [Nocardioides sp. AX2bis]
MPYARVHLATGQPVHDRGRRGGVRRRRRREVPLPGPEGPGLDLARYHPGAEGSSPAGADRLRHRRAHVRSRRLPRR